MSKLIENPKNIFLLAVILFLSLLITDSLMSYNASELNFSWTKITDEAQKINNLAEVESKYNTSISSQEIIVSDSFTYDEASDLYYIQAQGENIVGQSVTLKNVLINNKSIDIKYTITKASLYNTTNTEFITYNKNTNTFTSDGYSNVTYQVDFYEAGTTTKTKVSILTSYQDINDNEFFGYNQNAVDSSAYVTQNTNLTTSKINNNTYFGYQYPADVGNNNNVIDVTYDNISSFTFEYSKDYKSAQISSDQQLNYKANNGASFKIDIRPLIIDESDNQNESNNKTLPSGTPNVQAAYDEVTLYFGTCEYYPEYEYCEDYFYKEDALYNVYDSSGNLIAQRVENSIILPPGEYTIKPVKLPILYSGEKAYPIESEMTVTITGDEEYYMNKYPFERAVSSVEKDVVSQSGTNDRVVEDNEDITYSITITNETKYDLENIPVQDSMASGDTYQFLSYKGIESITFYDKEGNVINGSYSGDLSNRDFQIDNLGAGNYVVIKYTISFGVIPDDTTFVQNVVLTNGEDPAECNDSGGFLSPFGNVNIVSNVTATIDGGEIECLAQCEYYEDDVCDLNVLPVGEGGDANTYISKVIDDETYENPVEPWEVKPGESGSIDGVAEPGETLKYKIRIDNYSTKYNAIDVPVRDSFLENLPSYLTYSGEFYVVDENGLTYNYTGDLTDGTFKLDKIPPNGYVDIYYFITVGDVPKSVTELHNYATDNGVKPDQCIPDEIDCSDEVIPVANPNTHIKKSIIKETGSKEKIIENGETITYQLEISNPTDYDATNVVVRDSMLENLPDYLEYDGNIEVSVEYTGGFSSKDLTLLNVAANSTATITYNVTVTQLPSEISIVHNYVTDTGVNPENCIVDDIDCSDSQIVPGESGAIYAEKFVTDASKDNKAQPGEVLTYTIRVTNPNDTDVNGVIVKDDLSNAPALDTSTINNTKVNGNSVEQSILTGITVNIAANSYTDVTFDVSVYKNIKLAGPIVNIATIIDPNDPDNPHEPSTDIDIDKPGEVISKKEVSDKDGDGYAEKGETLTYTITVNNPTGVDVNDITVIDTLEEAKQLDPNTVSNLKVNGEHVKGSIIDGIVLDVPAGSEVKITFDVKVVENVKATTIKNVATVIDPNFPNDPQRPSASIDTQVSPRVTIAQTGFKYSLLAINILILIILARLILSRRQTL